MHNIYIYRERERYIGLQPHVRALERDARLQQDLGHPLRGPQRHDPGLKHNIL